MPKLTFFKVFLPINSVKRQRTVIDVDKLGPQTFEAQAYLPNNAIDLSNWISQALANGTITFAGPYCSDAEAGLDRIAIGGVYKLCKKNIYGMKEGVLKVREV